ncbi:hypothetical protein JD969_14010 [Planctomycetota bacterium]|nr:hypothetical protein JD969_14010 [Planctomycetota bacterium]
MHRFSKHFSVVLSLLLALSLVQSSFAAPKKKESKEDFGPYGQYVLDLAYAYEGGTYVWKSGSGVPFDMIHKGETILKKQPVGTYCCGFTVAIAFQVGSDFGVFDEFTPKQVKTWQQEWYGNTPIKAKKKEMAERQGAVALETLKIGREVKNKKDVRAGDFCNYWRKTVKGSSGGHSVIFLEWVKERGKIVGMKYRSSQGSTNGIGDNVEYFYGVKKDSKGKLKRGIDRDRLYFYRFFKPKESSKIEQAKKIAAQRKAEQALKEAAKKAEK